MPLAECNLFLPGFGARADFYAHGLPTRWQPLQPPIPTNGASLRTLRDWLVADLRERPGPVVLAGHSMGAALAMLAAARVPDRIAGLILIAPAGLPLSKSIRACAWDTLHQLRDGRYRPRNVATTLLDLARAPRASVRLVRTLRRLDLSPTMQAIGAARIPALVIGCSSDTLIPPAHTRTMARLLGAEYRELACSGGHVWMFGNWMRLRRELD